MPLIRIKNYELRIMLFISLFIIHYSLFIVPVYAAGFGPDPAGLDQIEQMIGNVISVMVGLAFIAMLVLIIIAGFKYLTSGGEPKAIQSAHQAFTWAILGLFFMIIAWLLLQLLQVFTGIDVTVFNIRTLCGVGGTQFCSPSPSPSPSPTP